MAGPRDARGEPRGALAVMVDGEPLPAEEARAFWGRFSAHMEEHKGDLAGFAKLEGFASVHPAMQNGEAILLASRTSAQRPYAPVAPSAHTRSGEGRGGSSGHQGSPRDPAKGKAGRGKGPKQRG
jgi:hypothetical protein